MSLSPLRLFYEIAVRASRRHLTHRAAELAGLATNVFFGLLRAAVLLALYSGRPSVEGHRLIQVPETDKSNGVVHALGHCKC